MAISNCLFSPTSENPFGYSQNSSKSDNKKRKNGKNTISRIKNYNL